MGFLDKLFGKKKQEKPGEGTVEDSSEGEAEYCPHCGLEMVEGVHQARVLNGKRFHKLCARTLMKQAKKQAFG